jgi:hypothetical protein
VRCLIILHAKGIVAGAVQQAAGLNTTARTKDDGMPHLELVKKVEVRVLTA